MDKISLKKMSLVTGIRYNRMSDLSNGRGIIHPYEQILLHDVKTPYDKSAKMKSKLLEEIELFLENRGNVTDFEHYLLDRADPDKGYEDVRQWVTQSKNRARIVKRGRPKKMGLV